MVCHGRANSMCMRCLCKCTISSRTLHEPFHPGICIFGLWTLINCTVNYDHVTSIINLCNHTYDKYGYAMRQSQLSCVLSKDNVYAF